MARWRSLSCTLSPWPHTLATACSPTHPHGLSIHSRPDLEWLVVLAGRVRQSLNEPEEREVNGTRNGAPPHVDARTHFASMGRLHWHAWAASLHTHIRRCWRDLDRARIDLLEPVGVAAVGESSLLCSHGADLLSSSDACEGPNQRGCCRQHVARLHGGGDIDRSDL